MRCIYLLLSMDCNLYCKYCFQGQIRSRYSERAGPNLRTSAKASTGMIDDFVRYCVNNGINHVEFFGGEPLIHKDLLEYTVASLCREISDLQIGVVTNGTLIDERTMKLFETRPVTILLSLDGRQDRHDSMRGGFSNISKWFPRLTAHGRVGIAFQAGIIPGLCENVRYIWQTGFKGVYINIIENYGWYEEKDVEIFEQEYENTLKAMLRGEGQLKCAIQFYQILKKPKHIQRCGIIIKGLGCDWQGLLYPCHRAMEMGSQFTIGDIRNGIDEKHMQKLRSFINRKANRSKSAKKHPLVSFCPVAVYKKHKDFNGEWNSAFCEMINIKAKLVAKYFYEIDEFCKNLYPGSKKDRPDENADSAYLCEAVTADSVS